MIVRDEQSVLPRCLSSVAQVADEMIVVDTGSTDGTQAVARQFGAKLFEREWPGDFAAARNEAFQQASGRWILVLDADEWLTPPNAAALRKLCQAEPDRAYSLVQKNLDASGQFIRNAIVRLIPNRPGVRYVYPIHEEVNPALAQAGIPVCATDVEIEHSGYATGEALAAKARRNRAIITAALARQPDSAEAQHLHYHLATSLFDEGRWAEAAEEFEWCLAAVPPGSRLARVSGLRAAECCFLLGSVDRAAALLPGDEQTSHPAALFLQAQIAVARRDPEAARRCYEALLAAPDVAHVPPVSLAAIKFKALAYLGRYWGERSRPERGIALLRIARDIGQRRRDGASATLAQEYHAIVDA